MLPPIDESKYIDLARWFRYVRDPYLQGASSRTTLFTRLSPAIGTWRMDNFKGLYGREVSIIVELDPHGLIDSELDTQGRLLPDRREDAQRYAQWICEGHLPPPIEVLETDKGNLKVTDGHRRLVAARSAGVSLRCWVSPTVNVPSSQVDCNGRPMKTGLTYEMWRERGDAAFSGSTFCQTLLAPATAPELAP